MGLAVRGLAALAFVILRGLAHLHDANSDGASSNSNAETVSPTAERTAAHESAPQMLRGATFSGRTSALRNLQTSVNPCATCSTCVAVSLPSQSGITDQKCASCANNGQSWWPCNTKPAQCQCGGGHGVMPSPPPPAPAPAGGNMVCVANPEYVVSNGVSDEQCAPCAPPTSQTWWPCNEANFCLCSDGTGTKPTSLPPTPAPTQALTRSPTAAPSELPTAAPTLAPSSAVPTAQTTPTPTQSPTSASSTSPTQGSAPTRSPTQTPTATPTPPPTPAPTESSAPPVAPTAAPSISPTPPPTAESTTDSGDGYINVCYFTNWARYRSGLINQGKDVFEMGNLDADLCTHFMYGFATLELGANGYELRSNDPNADHPSGHAAQDTLCPTACNDPSFKPDWNDPNGIRCDWPCNPTRTYRGYEGMNVAMKQANPKIKSLISVGGWNFNDCACTDSSVCPGQGALTCEIFSTIAASEEKTRQFAQNVIKFCQAWGFDGFDLDWEYPVVAGHNSLEKDGDGKFVTTPQDYDNYISMLKVFKEEFQKANPENPLRLTVAVGVGKATTEQAYNIPEMSKYLDLINLMSYDLHGAWESFTGCNANLYATAADIANGGSAGNSDSVGGYPLSVSWAVDYWLARVTTPRLLTMGLATYGRGWTLANPSVTSYLADASGPCAPGTSTKSPGFWAYYEILDALNKGAKRHYDDERQCPYIVTADGQWIGYDDTQSYRHKLEYLKASGLAGMMFWALDLDDFADNYPLISFAREYLRGGRVPTAPTPPPALTGAPTTSPTTASSPMPAPPTPVTPTPEPVSGAVCVAASDPPQAVTDSDCAPCAPPTSQTWWPCNVEGLCVCSGASAPAPSPTPSSPSTPPPPAPATFAPPTAPSAIESWFRKSDFEQFFPNINNPSCSGANFFTYEAFIEATKHFPTFANTGNQELDQRELAAFFGQTSHETTGGWATAPGGPFAWGYCFKEEVGCEFGGCTGYCAPNEQYPCVAGQTYQGRGPIQLSYNYNYGPFSEDSRVFGDKMVLLSDPGRVASDPKVAFMSGLWFWMTPQAPKPSCHDVMTGDWEPTSDDLQKGRAPGYGMVTNIINGGLECNMPTNAKVDDRVGFYKRYANILEVTVDESTLYCDSMVSYR